MWVMTRSPDRSAQQRCDDDLRIVERCDGSAGDATIWPSSSVCAKILSSPIGMMRQSSLTFDADSGEKSQSSAELIRWGP